MADYTDFTVSCTSTSSSPFSSSSSSTTWGAWTISDTSTGEWYSGTLTVDCSNRTTWGDWVAERGSYRREAESDFVSSREETMRAVSEAQRKADALLDEFLDNLQRKSLQEHGFFEVISPCGKIYHIHKGRVNNVREIDDQGNAIAALCALPEEYVPDSDVMLAQKLMLETAEDEFLRIANRSILCPDFVYIN